MNMNSPALLTSALCVTRPEFAAMLNVSVRTVDRMIAAKEIRVRRVRGKVVRILRSEAERYLGPGSLQTGPGGRPALAGGHHLKT